MSDFFEGDKFPLCGINYPAFISFRTGRQSAIKNNKAFQQLFCFCLKELIISIIVGFSFSSGL